MGLLRKKRIENVVQEGQEFLLSDQSPFAIQEAYKTLRTNVMFSLAGKGCKTIVVTSGLQGEAKSTSSINLAIAFSQNHSKVLLIDCDLRLPTGAKKLGIEQKIGLTNVLIEMNDADDVICHLPSGLDVIPAGEIPPNPSELLGSDSMRELLAKMQTRYDYIILDTPPVCAVSDASILASYASGVLMVVRQNLADRREVDKAVQTLEFAGAKLLGFVFTGVSESNRSKSYRKHYYAYGN